MCWIIPQHHKTSPPQYRKALVATIERPPLRRLLLHPPPPSLYIPIRSLQLLPFIFHPSPLPPTLLPLSPPPLSLTPTPGSLASAYPPPPQSLPSFA